MDVDNFFDETDVATLLLMSTCIQDEMAELDSARLANDLSAESIDTGVDSVFSMDITFVICQSIELMNSLEALDRRIAQLEQARSRPEPYRVSNEDQALIKSLVSENAEREIDHAYAMKLQEMLNKGTVVNMTLSVEQLLDGNTISRMKVSLSRRETSSSNPQSSRISTNTTRISKICRLFSISLRSLVTCQQQTSR